MDICFSKTLNSCKVPQIRYASVERLLERLTDLRFLSIDFLNTFLHTYRIFTTAAVVIDKLTDIYKKPFTSIPVRWGRCPAIAREPRCDAVCPSALSFVLCLYSLLIFVHLFCLHDSLPPSTHRPPYAAPSSPLAASGSSSIRVTVCPSCRSVLTTV